MGSIGDSFVGLPIEVLIAQPLISVAEGQSELCEVYLEQLYKLAYKDGDKEAGVANVISFKLTRPVIDKDGNVTSQEIEVQAPLLTLVPVPSFTMDEATVKFTMEVKEQTVRKDASSASAETEAGFSRWGFKASITGKVATSSENTRSTDQSAKYEIYARAAQQAPTEGMNKLTSIFASVMEPVTVESK